MAKRGHHGVDEELESLLLGRGVVRPQRQVRRARAVAVDPPEEVFATVRGGEVVALHVEEDVVRGRRRQRGEAAVWGQRIRLDQLPGGRRLTVREPLERRLQAQPIEDGATDLTHLDSLRQLAQGCQGVDPRRDQLGALVATDPGHEREVVHGAPLRRAAILPVAVLAGRHRVRHGALEPGVDGDDEAPANGLEV